MHFNHFRLFITLLASFGPFFAYICRLNLSLTIETMVKPVVNETVSVYNYQDDISSPIFLEEHALASWSRFVIRQRNLQKYTKRTRHNATHSSKSAVGDRRDGLLFPLATIDFDVDVLKQTSEHASQQNAANNVSNNSSTIPDDIDIPKTEPVDDNLLDWSQKEKDFTLSAYFVGYVVFQVMAARFAEVYGAKPMFLAIGIGSGVCSLMFPLACKLSVILASIIRIALGGFQAGLFPACYVLLCEWLPKDERSKWLAWPSAFSRVGTIVMNLMVPYVLENHGWEGVFYLSGGVTLAWSVVFFVLAANSPNQSYWISKAELVYIESHMEPRVGTLKKAADVTGSGFTINESASDALKKPSLSWRRLVFSKPVIVLSFVMFTSEWSNMLLLLKLAGFLSQALKFDIVEIANWTSILVAVYCINFPLSGFIAATLETSDFKALGTLRVRKIFEAAAHAMQGIGSLMVAFSSDKHIIACALLLMMLGRSTVGGGQCLMPPELSKDYPGTVFAYANSLANLAGFFGPNLVAVIVSDPMRHESWFPLWILSAVIFFAGGLTFCIFAENSPQNYCRKPKARGSGTQVSQAQLMECVEPEIFKMDAFARVASEPNPRQLGRRSSKGDAYLS